MSARLGRWLLLGMIVVLVLGGALLAALPSLARRAAIWGLQAQTGRTVSIDAVDISLLTGRFSVRGFRVTDRDGGLLAEFDRLEGRLHRRSFVEARVWIESLTLTNGHVRIVRVGPDRFNVSDLLDRPRAAGGGLDVSVDRFVIAGGWVELEDRVLKPVRAWRSADLRLDARELTTRRRSGFAIGSTSLAGALVNVRVDELQLAPVHLRAQVNVRDLDLTLAALYLPADLLVRLDGGVMDMGFTIVTDAHEGTTLDAEGVVRQVALGRPGLPGHVVTTPELQILVRELRQQPGAIALRYASAGGDVTVLDPTTSPPTPLTFGEFTFTASGLEQPQQGPARVAIHALLPGGGEVDAGGSLGLEPRRVELDVRARHVTLASIARYLPLQGRVQGTGAADLHIVVTHDRDVSATVGGEVTLERLSVSDATRPLAAAERVTLRGLDCATPARVRIGELALTRPSLILERDAAGALNLAALARPPAATGAAAATGEPLPALDVALARLRLDDGQALLTDAATGGRVEVTRLALLAEDLAWPARGPARVRVTAVAAGGEIDARGTLDGATRRADLTLKVKGADLATLQPWLPITGRVRGAGDADVTFTLGLQPFALALRGAVGAGNLAFLDGARPLLTVTRFDATGVDLQWPTRLAVERLRVNTPWLEVARDTRGELSLRALFARRPDRPAPAPAEAPAGGAGLVPGLQISVADARFDDGGATIVDDAVEPAARFEIRGSRLDLKNLTWPARGNSDVRLNTPMPGGGTLKARGAFSIEPTRLTLDAELDQVDLAPARPYLPFDARLAGKITGHAKLTGAFGDTLSLVVEGDSRIDRLRIGDDTRRLATTDRVDVTGFRYHYPTGVRINQIALHKPWLLVERDTQGRLELLTLLSAKKVPARAVTAGAAGAAVAAGAPAGAPKPLVWAPAGAPAGAAAPAAPPTARAHVLVSALTIEDGFVRFVDRTTDPAYAEELSAIALTAENLGTGAGRHGTIDLRGTLGSGNPLGVKGQIGAPTGPLFVDVTVDVREFPVPRLNPYLDRMSSWVAREGVVTATLRYHVEGDDLRAGNDIVIAGLEVEEGGHGEEFHRRIGLPLGTLVSLLKDRHGVITLNLPVGGRLSAPDFEYAEAVWTALRNVTVRLVTLPFSLIGKVFFTEDSRIQTVQIDPVAFHTARATPTPEGAAHLEKLATFLKTSPGVRLRLRPVTTTADVTALRRAALETRLATLGADEAARRHAAVGLYAEMFPRRQPPTSDEALYDELARETPAPPRALRTLATDRVSAARDALVQAGVAAERLQPQESRTAVESEGAARVEFEVAH